MEDEIKKILKSILICSPAKLQAYQLNEDFKRYVGKNIPFEEYGYENLMDFLHSLTDILVVQGDNIFSTVQLKCPHEIIKRQPARRKGKKKKSGKAVATTKNDQATIPPLLKPTNSCSNGSSVNNINIDPLKNEQMEKITTIKRRFAMYQKLHEQKKARIEIEEPEKQELRYPKTVVAVEKNGSKFDIFSLKTLHDAGLGNSNGAEKLSPFIKGEEKTRILECIRNRRKIPRRLPGKKISVPTDNLVDLGDEFSRPTDEPFLFHNPLGINTSISLLDQPIPSFLPDISTKFVKKKSDDLIDFDDDGALLPLPQNLPAPQVKPLPFMEVLKLMKNLQIS